MLNRLICLLLVCQTLLSGAPCVSPDTVAAMKQGALLRLHVVAQDDTGAMQALKLPVRDAVRARYAALCDPRAPMLTEARRLLPALTEAAEEAARGAGFDGPVSVRIETRRFGARVLSGLCVPAGDYPALMIRLGEAAGRNWWGLIDPEAALRAAAVDEPGDAPWRGNAPWRFDWSWEELLSALMGFFLPAEGGDGDA